MKQLAFILLFSAYHLLVYAQKPFDHLETYVLKTEYMGEIPIHYSKELGTIIDSTLINLPKSHPLFTDEAGASDVLAMELRFNRNSSKRYYLIFSSGPSDDPSFFFYDIDDSKWISAGSGLEIYIPGNNNTYTTGHANSMFNIRRKYVFNGSKFEEAKPELYYVGMKTKTLKSLKLYSDQGLTKEFANLPADYDIEVLIAERPNEFKLRWKYLIKTNFGLVGWTYIDAGQYKSIDVDGIFFKGD